LGQLKGWQERFTKADEAGPKAPTACRGGGAAAVRGWGGLKQ
jgi:hypothetical protein